MRNHSVLVRPANIRKPSPNANMPRRIFAARTRSRGQAAGRPARVSRSFNFSIHPTGVRRRARPARDCRAGIRARSAAERSSTAARRSAVGRPPVRVARSTTPTRVLATDHHRRGRALATATAAMTT
jgi:hypothetical protein